VLSTDTETAGAAAQVGRRVVLISLTTPHHLLQSINQSINQHAPFSQQFLNSTKSTVCFHRRERPHCTRSVVVGHSCAELAFLCPRSHSQKAYGAPFELSYTNIITTTVAVAVAIIPGCSCCTWSPRRSSSWLECGGIVSVHSVICLLPRPIDRSVDQAIARGWTACRA